MFSCNNSGYVNLVTYCYDLSYFYMMIIMAGTNMPFQADIIAFLYPSVETEIMMGVNLSGDEFPYK